MFIYVKRLLILAGLLKLILMTVCLMFYYHSTKNALLLEQENKMLDIAPILAQIKLLPRLSKENKQQLARFESSAGIYHTTLLFKKNLRSLKNNKAEFYLKSINGNTYIEGLIPLFNIATLQDSNNNQMAIELTSDYSNIHETLLSRFNHILIIIMFIILLFIFFVLFRLHNQAKIKYAKASSERLQNLHNMDQLFHLLKEQRHDLNNQVATIQALIQLNEFKDLTHYTNEIFSSYHDMNEIILINVPLICALIQAKKAEAIQLGIHFIHEIADISLLKTETKLSIQLIKIIGNLIDNAYAAASNTTLKLVKLFMTIENNWLIIKVSNSCEFHSNEFLQQIFNDGFTTKNEINHMGIGLSIVKKLIVLLRGTVSVEADTVSPLSFLVGK